MIWPSQLSGDFVDISSMSNPDFLNQRIAVIVLLFCGSRIWPLKVMALSGSFFGKVGWVSFAKVVMRPWSVVFGLQFLIFEATSVQFWDEPNCWVSMAAMRSISSWVMGLCMRGIVAEFLVGVFEKNDCLCGLRRIECGGCYGAIYEEEMVFDFGGGGVGDWAYAWGFGALYE